MTRRATLIGVLGALLLCVLTFFNDRVMNGTFLILHFLPCSVFGGLLVLTFVVNPILKAVRRPWCFRPGELAVMAGIPLMVCAIPGGGLFEHFHNVLAMPRHFARIEPGWSGTAARFDARDVVDWPALCRSLNRPSERPEATALVRAVHAHLSEPVVAQLRGTAPDEPPPAPVQDTVLSALNLCLEDHALLTAGRDGPVPVDRITAARMRRADHSSDPEEIRRLNRVLFETALPGVFQPREPGVVERVPPGLMPDASRDNRSVVLDGYVNSLSEGDALIHPSRVPWRAWLPAYCYWLPLVVCLSVGMIGLALVIHPQWSRHEHLPYPIAQFAAAIVGRDRASAGHIVRSRAFWAGSGIVFLIHMNNYACAWWPRLFIPIQRRLDLAPLLRLVPWMASSPVPVNWIGRPIIYAAIVGIAFLLPRQVSLSVGLAPYVFAFVTGALSAYGVACSTRFGMEPSVVLLSYAGAWCAMFLVVVYNGRRYYGSAFARAVGLTTLARGPDAARRWDSVPPQVVWGARSFMAAMGIFVLGLLLGGLSLLTACLFASLIVIIQVVASRVLAEAGVFHFHPHFFAATVIWALFGSAAIGPQQLLLLCLFSALFLANPREALLPFVATALRMGEDTSVSVQRLARRGALAVLLGLLVAGPVTLYLHYQYGAMRTGDGWTAVMLPKLPFEATVGTRRTLASQGLLERSEQASGLERIALINPNRTALLAFAVAFALVLGFTVLRHRFTWWPLHPVLLLMLATAQSMSGGFSFLVGWLLKSITMTYGGTTVYARVRPVMLGLIAGEILASVVPMVIGTIYWIAAGTSPPVFSVLR